MAVQVYIPALLRRLAKDQAALACEASTVRGLLATLAGQFPGLEERLSDPEGRLRVFVNLFVNGEDIRCLEGLDTPLNDGDEVVLASSSAGG
ncbi:MAG: MoaD/ThiS family protein [Armatimonadetes bacterium]|nr:MoaD/ThiS family protein [Armatimonadota bacterium]